MEADQGMAILNLYKWCLTLALVDSWASASSHVSCWSRDDDSLAFESLSLASLQSSDPAHSIITDGLQRLQQYNHPTLIRDGNHGNLMSINIFTSPHSDGQP